MLRVGCLFLIIGLALAKHEVYDGYGLYKVSVKTPDQVELVNYLSKALDLDVWSHAIPGHDGQVLVPKDKKSLFQNELKAAGVEFQIESDNIKDILDLEDQLLSEAARKNNGSRLDSLPFDQIYTYHQVDTFLEMLAAAYPETVTLVNAGKSFEGRDIKYIKVSSGDFETSTKPIVFMESLLHAREWITLPATLYAIHKLVIDVTEQDLIQDIDWIILPIANPDGYVHSHGEFRLWRKNRNTNLGVGCMGVDLNRNFDINWSEASSNVPCLDTYHGRGPFSEPETSIIKSVFDQYVDRIGLFLDIHSFGFSRLWRKNRNTNLGVGCMGVDLNRNFDINWSEASSSIPCLDNYHGRGPFSEPEASAIKSIFDKYIDRIGLFLDIHSFGSMILYAYGNGVLPPNGLMIHLLGVRMAESIDAVKMSWNPNYIVGNSAMVLYDDSGTASDYAQSIGVPYSYAYELPGHRFGIGGFGFFVDPAFIEQAGFETWEGIKTGARFIRDNFTKSKQSLS